MSPLWTTPEANLAIPIGNLYDIMYECAIASAPISAAPMKFSGRSVEFSDWAALPYT